MLIDGRDIADVTQASLRAQIGVVPQDTVGAAAAARLRGLLRVPLRLMRRGRRQVGVVPQDTLGGRRAGGRGVRRGHGSAERAAGLAAGGGPCRRGISW